MNGNNVRISKTRDKVGFAVPRLCGGVRNPTAWKLYGSIYVQFSNKTVPDNIKVIARHSSQLFTLSQDVGFQTWRTQKIVLHACFSQTEIKTYGCTSYALRMIMVSVRATLRLWTKLTPIKNYGSQKCKRSRQLTCSMMGRMWNVQSETKWCWSDTRLDWPF